MKPIIRAPQPVLTTAAIPVKDLSKKLKNVVAAMTETLMAADNPKGVGLAAPQIGYSLRIFMIRAHEQDPILTVINPKITWKSSKLIEGIPGNKGQLEGCLSIPKVWGIVKRHESIEISFQDERGNEKKQKFEGFDACIIQHELDHLEGILFTQRVLGQQGKLYKTAVDENGKEILEPFEI